MRWILTALLSLLSFYPQQTVDNEYRVITGGLNVQVGITSPLIGKTVYVDDVNNTSIASAFAQCSSSQACVIHAEGAVGTPALNFGVFDPGSIATTIYLGPNSGYVGEFILRNNLNVHGQWKSTQITQINPSTPIFALPTSG